MKLVFCNSLLEPYKPDADFEEEFTAAKRAGIDPYLMSLESFQEGDLASALRKIPTLPQPELAIYRGWMLRAEEYEALYNALMQKNWQLINSPAQYAHCHYFPNAYPTIQAYTPQSIWLEVAGEVNFDEIAEKLHVFAGKPVVIKDYVKSEKHYWQEACFIPSAANRQAVESVTNRFLALRGSFLNEGLVYREFVELEHLTHHSKSGMPLAKEFRLFYLYGKLLAQSPYWEEGEYAEEQPDFEQFTTLASRIDSHFFTMDVAKQTNGTWIIMELGDGQVSGLPDTINKADFYERLQQ